MSIKKFFQEFRPKEKGLGKVLGSLEAEVMEIVWRKASASVKEVHEELLAERPIAYTTVMTIMSRLAEKKLLSKQKDGNAFIYAPVVSKDEFSYNVASEVLDGLFEDFSQETILHFTEKMRNEDTSKIDALEKILKERLAKEE